MSPQLLLLHHSALAKFHFRNSLIHEFHRVSTNNIVFTFARDLDIDEIPAQPVARFFLKQDKYHIELIWRAILNSSIN